MKCFCQNGWPAEIKHDYALKPYWAVQSDITVAQGLLLNGTRLIIPASMRADILDRLHEGHQGITKTRERAKSSVWWPGLSKQLHAKVEKCDTCSKYRRQAPEPLLPSPTPEGPWTKLGADLFHLDNSTYLLVFDYFSRFIEIAKLTSTTSSAVVERMKSWFSRLGVPVISDNGPQFASETFRQFSETWGFTHTTSSPLFPQSNGAAERAVQTAKQLLCKSPDPYLALLAYRSTPLANGFSPAELLQGRKLRTTLPTLPSLLAPEWPYLSGFAQKDRQYKLDQKAHFDHRHRTKTISPLRPGDPVWVQDSRERGVVQQSAETPRSYHISVQGQTIRRNRRHLTLAYPDSVPSGLTSDVGPPSPVPCAGDPTMASADAAPLQQPSPPRRYPERVRAPPVYLIDFTGTE